MAYNRRDDDLAYGDYHGQGQQQPQREGEEGERGFIGDMGKRFFGGGGNVSALSLRNAMHREPPLSTVLDVLAAQASPLQPTTSTLFFRRPHYPLPSILYSLLSTLYSLPSTLYPLPSNLYTSLSLVAVTSPIFV